MYRLLILEDDVNMRLGLKDNLVYEGYEVVLAEDGQEGWELLQKSDYDLVVLDVMMPRMSGFDVCRKMRENGIKTPVIMLTARGEEIDKVLGLELGADDYMTKPFSLRELVARIKAVLRRTDNPDEALTEPIEVGYLRIDPKNYTATCRGESVSLSHKEFEIIKLFWDHRGQTVSREQLLNKVWGYSEFPTTRTVDNFILKLRKKVEEDPAHPRHILTVHGIGYKLVV